MAKETNEILEHDYDGIQEYDNPLPPWWLMLFYITVAWGFIYFAYFHIFNIGDLPEAEYAKEMAAAELKMQQQSEMAAADAKNQIGTNLLYGADALAAGKVIYNKPGQCISCHGALGAGVIGPNLTDDFWIHGDGSLESIVKVVTEGVPAKGMITWGGILKPEEIGYVSLFVLSLQGTEPPNPKAPQGKEI